MRTTSARRSSAPLPGPSALGPDPDRGSFRGWLSRIARNLLINFLTRGRTGSAAAGRPASRSCSKPSRPTTRRPRDLRGRVPPAIVPLGGRRGKASSPRRPGGRSGRPPSRAGAGRRGGRTGPLRRSRVHRPQPGPGPAESRIDSSVTRHPSSSARSIMAFVNPCDPDDSGCSPRTDCRPHEVSGLEEHLEHCPVPRGARRHGRQRALDRGGPPVPGPEPTGLMVGTEPIFRDDETLGVLVPSDWPDSLGRLGTYEVKGVIGRGGMGVVLKAFDPALNRNVAIKVLSPHLAKRRRAAAVSARGEGGRGGRARARGRRLRRRRDGGAAVHGHGIRPRPLAPGPARSARAAGAGGGPAHRHADGRRAGRRTCPGAGAPRRQAGQHPAGKRRRAGQADRLRPGPRRGRRRHDPERRRGRHAALHGPRAGPRRGDRPPRRPVQPGKHALRHVHRRPAVPGRDAGGRAPPGLRRRAPADPADQPRRPGMAGSDRRSSTPRTRPSGLPRRPSWPISWAIAWRTSRSR